MAGGRVCVLLAAVVCCLTVLVPVNGLAGLCDAMESCMKAFRDKARLIGHEQETYCELYREEMHCMNSVVNGCPTDLQDFARQQIVSRQKDQMDACDASFLTSSVLVVTVAATFALLYRGFL